MKASRLVVGEKYKVGVIVGTYVRMNGKMIVLENNGTEVHANPNDKIKKYTGDNRIAIHKQISMQGLRRAKTGLRV